MERDFAALHSPIGRPSIPPEKLLRARWFIGIGVDDAAWDHSVFSKNRDRVLEGNIAAKFLAAVLAQPKVKKLLSNDHFSVDGTLIEDWASMKSVKPKNGSGEPPAQGAMPRRTSVAQNARTTPILRPPIRLPGCTARARTRQTKRNRQGPPPGHRANELRYSLA